MGFTCAEYQLSASCNFKLILLVNLEKKFLVFQIFLMKQKNIFLGIHYPYPVHMQKGFKDKIIVKNDLCITEKLCQSIVSLPIYPELESKMALKVIKELKNFDVERI